MNVAVIDAQELGRKERRSRLASRRVSLEERSYVRCRRARSKLERWVCARLRADVYVWEKKWIPRGQLVEGLEFDKDDARSVHLLARRGGEPVGTARLILPRAREPLPVEAMLAEPLMTDRSGGEVSRLAVARHARGDSAVMMALARGLYEAAVEHGIEDFYALVEEPLHLHLVRLGFPFRPMGPTRWVYRSWNFPARVEAARVAEALAAFEAQREARPIEPNGGAS